VLLGLEHCHAHDAWGLLGTAVAVVDATMREDFTSFGFLAVTLAGVALLCSSLVALTIVS